MIRWGMIGCGDVTEKKSAPAYTIRGKSSLQAVTSRTLSRARDYARRHNVPHVFESPKFLVQSEAVNAIYIATPPASHVELALLVAHARKPCCIEKPIANSHAEAVQITQAFADTNTPLFIAYYRRSLPRFRAIKKWIDDGKIGAVRHVHWRLTRTPNQTDIDGKYTWRVDPLQAPGGYFDDLAGHGLDLFDFYFGPIAKVSGHTENQQNLYKVPDAFSASWIHTSGATGTGIWNFAGFERSDDVEIIGERGRIHFSMFDDQPISCITSAGETTRDIEHPEHLHKFHVENMIANLECRHTHPSTGESATRTAWVCDQIIAS